MTLQSLPVSIMAAIVLYVGSYHLLLYTHRPQARQHLTFGLTCLAIGCYDALSAVLYNQSDPANSRIWLHWLSLVGALSAVFLLHFVVDYTSLRVNWLVKAISLAYAPVLLAALLRPGEWLWTHVPLVKSVTLPGGWTFIYNETVVGPIWYLQSALNITVLAYAFWAGVSYYRQGQRREALPLLIALLVFGLSVLNDAAVNAGLYQFLYLVDYAYLPFVLLMTLLLSAEALQKSVIERAVHHSERRLASANLMLQIVLDSIPVRVFWKDKNSVYLGCNRLFAQDAGRKEPAELIGENDFAMGWRNEAEMYRADDHQVVESGQPRINYEEPQTTPEGAKIWLRTSKVPLRNPEGEIIGLLGTYEDITERKRKDEALRQSEENLNITLNSIGDAVIATDADSRVRRMNPVAEELTGWSADEAWGRPLTEVFRMVDPATLQGIPSPAATVLRTGEKKVLDRAQVLVAHDGKQRRIADSAAPIRGPEGEILGVVLVFRDVTEELALQEQLMHSQKMEAIGLLAGGVAHDFNNLLQAIQGYTESALQNLDPGQHAYHDLQEVRRASGRAGNLTRQLLTFGRPSQLQRVDLDLNTLVADLANMLRRVIGEQIELVVQAVENLHRVDADPGQMEQVLVNLCINARDAMPEGGKLMVTTQNLKLGSRDYQRHPWSQPGDYVLLTVSDTGKGIPPHIRDRVFEPFFTTKRDAGGTGLGLATAYAIIERHGGMIELESEEGGGTTFRIFLPASRKPEEERQNPEAVAAGRGGGEWVLVAEDDNLVRNLTVQILQRAGYRLLVAADGAEAIDLFMRHMDEISLAVVDVVMPRMGGREVHDAIKARRPDIPVLFHSGYSFESIGVEQLPESDYHLIQKPYRPKQLLDKVSELLRGSAM